MDRQQQIIEAIAVVQIRGDTGGEKGIEFALYELREHVVLRIKWQSPAEYRPRRWLTKDLFIDLNPRFWPQYAHGHAGAAFYGEMMHNFHPRDGTEKRTALQFLMWSDRMFDDPLPQWHRDAREALIQEGVRAQTTHDFLYDERILSPQMIHAGRPVHQEMVEFVTWRVADLPRRRPQRWQYEFQRNRDDLARSSIVMRDAVRLQAAQHYNRIEQEMWSRLTRDLGPGLSQHLHAMAEAVQGGTISLREFADAIGALAQSDPAAHRALSDLQTQFASRAPAPSFVGIDRSRDGSSMAVQFRIDPIRYTQDSQASFEEDERSRAARREAARRRRTLEAAEPGDSIEQTLSRLERMTTQGLEEDNAYRQADDHVPMTTARLRGVIERMQGSAPVVPEHSKPLGAPNPNLPKYKAT